MINIMKLFKYHNSHKFLNKKDIIDLESKNINKLDTKEIDKKICAVENFDNVLQYICEDKKRSIQLTTFLKKEFITLFGKCNTRIRGEFYYYVWIVEFDDEIFNIFTAKDKGTQFSIVANYEDDKSKKCIKFLKKIELMLNSLNDK